MSAELGGIVDVIGDVAGSTVDLLGAAIKGAASATFHGAAAIAKMSATAAQAVGETAVGAVKELCELNKIVCEEKKRQKDAYESYVKSVKRDEERRKQYLDKLERMVAFDALGIKEQNKKKLQLLSENEKIKVFNDLINIQSKFSEISNLFFGLSDRGVEADCEYEFYKIKKQFAENVNKGVYVFDGIFKNLENLIGQLRILRNTVKDEEAAQFVGVKLFDIENELGNPVYTGFSAELYESLRQPREAVLTEEDRLLEVEKDVLEMAALFGGFNFEYQEKDEFQNLLNSIKKIILSDDGAETKLQFIDLRYRRLKNLYEKVRLAHEDAVELKRRYNNAVSLNYNLKEYLSLQLPQFEFDFAIAENQIASLSAENEELMKKAAERQKAEYIRKTVRETMKEMSFKYICSQSALTAGKVKVETDVYHIEDGNVVSVTFVNGKVRCSVSGVEFDGIPKDNKSIVKSMEKFCSKSEEIQRKLEQNGVVLDIEERIEPDERYAQEIKLKNVSASSVQIVKNAKLNRARPQAQAKKKYLK